MALHISRRIFSKVSSIVCLLVFLNLGLVAWPQPQIILDARAADQTQLLYVSAEGNLTVVNADGSGARQLASGVYFAQWSPDGSKIAYIERTTNADYSRTAVIINADGSNPRRLEGNASPSSFTWAPNSQHLAYSTANQLIIVNLDGSNTVKVTANGYTDDPFWAPGSDYLIYGVFPTEGAMAANMPMDVYTTTANGSNPHKLFNIPWGELSGFWVDGQRLLLNETETGNPVTNPPATQVPGTNPPATQMPGMNRTDTEISSREDPNTGTKWQLSIVDQDGSNKVALPKKQPLDLQNATLSLDGSQVLLGISSPVVVDTANPASGKEIAFPDTYIAASIWSKAPGKILAVLSKNSNFSLEEIDVATLQRRVIASRLPVKPSGQLATETLPFSDFALEQGGNVVMSDLEGTIILVDTASGKIKTLAGQPGVLESGGWQFNSNSNKPVINTILPDFYNVWKQSDLAVSKGQSNRSWLWGPSAFATKTEPYKEAKGGNRQVQYFDKARMEVNNPDGDRSSLYFVTNGLLPKELIGGYVQTGDSESQPKSPAEVNVAGDPGGSITYAKLAGVVTLEPGKNSATNRVGQAVTATIDQSGIVGEGAKVPGVTLTQYIPETGHNLPNVFVDYFKTLPQNWVSVTGLPISEPYLTDITLSGKPTQALVQVFERRVLTYTPSNTPAFQVEQGNVGRHYYQWLYGGS
ncbi:MAG: hypothetical protein WCS37_13260 [Chloroflexota bacterium]|nr:hypothetical protein [Chloroflexota bacterium]